MRCNVKFLLAVCLILGLNLPSSARIRQVPRDHQTIQQAISASANGDTVLVFPGRYVENIDFGGRNIVVGSLYLTTEDEAYIDSTIVDGNASGPVFHFHRGELPQARVTGFTVQNGSGYASGNNTFGGGFHCWTQSNPTLDHLRVRNCTATFGGGIYCQDTNGMRISYVVVENCTANFGGGIRILRGNATLDHVDIHNNTANGSGGALHLVVQGVGRITNVTAANNRAQSGGGIWVGFGSQATVSNTIIWNNTGTNIVYNANDTLANQMNISYSDIQGGRQGINPNGGELIWGAGNIDQNPLFVNLNNNDLHLTEDSPCIDAGNPNGTVDPDGSRADMGAYYFAVQSSRLFGWVLDLTDDSPLPEASVRTSLGQQAVTDEEGFWEIPTPLSGQFRITANKEFFNTTTTEPLRLGIEDTLEVIIRLPHPEFNVSADTVRFRVLPDSNIRTQIAVRNSGNGPLHFDLEKRLVGDDVVDPWDLRRSIPTGAIVDDDQLKGVVFTGDNFYISGTNEGGSTSIYVLDREGQLIRRFDQAGEAQLGMRDLAWDGTLIWGSGERMVFGFNTNGDLIRSFSGPFYPNYAIAWDSDRSILWMCGIVSEDIAGYNREGQEVARVSRGNIRNIFGLAYYPGDADGYQLYVLSCPSGERQLVSKIDVVNNQTMSVCDLEPQQGGRPEGAFITNNYDRLSWVFMGVISNPVENGSDRVDIYQLSARSEWIAVEPLTGEVEHGLQFLVTIFVNSQDLPPGAYRCELRFTHNAVGSEAVVSVEMQVLDPRTAPECTPELPQDFRFDAPYPNPFNQVLNISYQLPAASQVKIHILEPSGRLVAELFNGEIQAGVHKLTYGGDNLPAGVYLVKFKSDQYQLIRKVVYLP